MEKKVYNAPEADIEILLGEDIVLMSLVDGTYDGDANAQPFPEW